MIVIVCVDDHNGMMFNGRRQSQDRRLREHILQSVSPHRLHMSLYTKKQFIDVGPERVAAEEDFLGKAGPGSYCFVEDKAVIPYADKIEKVILYKWNRSYPADVFFPLDLSGWALEETEDFPGYSHEKITKEIYGR